MVTDGSGRSSFLYVPARQEYSYLISKDGYEQVSDTVYLETDTTIQILLEPATGLHETSARGIWIYPNPVKDKLYISFNEDEGELRLSAMDGKLIMIRKLFRGTGTIDLSGLPEGSYLLDLRSATSNWNQMVIKVRE